MIKNITRNNRIILAILLVVISLSWIYVFKKNQTYQAAGIFQKLDLPRQIDGWNGQEVKQDLQLGQGLFSYIGAYQMLKYKHQDGRIIFVTLMDAGNFHHPKLCFKGSGYVAQEHANTLLNLQHKTMSVETTFFKKPRENTLVIYWLTVNQHHVNWTEQKAWDLLFRLLGKKREGLIVRIDVLTGSQGVNQSIEAVKDFTRSLSEHVDENTRLYLFGDASKS